MNVTNEKEIALFGIRRSGNHAIIHWLIHHMGKRVVHLNDVTSASPYDSCTEINVKGLPLCQSSLSRFQSSLPRFRPSRQGIKNLYRYLTRNQEVIEYSMRDKDVDWNAIRCFTPKDCLIISYENSFLENIAYSEYVKQHDINVGCSEQSYRIVVLRDAFNLFASLLRMSLATAQDIEQCVEIYKQYAEIFIDPGKQERLNLICINFNEWFNNSNYRIHLAQRLGVNINGDPFQKVPSIGGGSSFNGMAKDGKAQEMKVLERWKTSWRDPKYQAIFRDTHLVELTNAIFGQIVPASWQT